MTRSSRKLLRRSARLASVCPKPRRVSAVHDDKGGIVLRRDRRVLQKIEEDLTASDPDLMAAFDQVKPSANVQAWWVVLVVADVTAILMIMVGLFSDSGLVFLGGVAAASALVWTHTTFRTKPADSVDRSGSEP
ncbi:hypothetical protein CVV72_08765 [Amycolatopsis sp. TNS106]|nr:hypothetical protein CVV72_08765 [Amycolatopsis sp. TNS106]